MKLLILAAVLLGCCCLAATAQDVPSEWTCAPELYAGADGCDCACGAFDPDCLEIPFIRGCDYREDSLYFCNGDGECVYFQREIPSNWYCEDITYNNEDGICDCSCGAYDPDCDAEDAVVARCHAGLNPTCSSEGSCEYEAPLPEGWVCSGYLYGTNDGCDCTCGIEDPDCATQEEVFGCPCAEMQCIAGNCAGFCNGYMLEVSLVSDELAARGISETDYDSHHETCSVEERYRFNHIESVLPGVTEPENSASLPPFDPRNIDHSVDESLYKDYIHKKGNTPHGKAMLKQWGFFDVYQTDTIGAGMRPVSQSRQSRMTPPAEWTCNPSYFDAQDGCDCECGAHDPDCDLPAQYVFGCDDDLPDDDGHYLPSCAADDTCTFEEIIIPDGWRCDPNYYHRDDGCDCTCGVYDPDCDPLGAVVLNCNKGYNATCTLDTAVCEYLEPVPDTWTCPYYLYNDGWCHCNCGAEDIDCLADDIERVVGCGTCEDPEFMTCGGPGICSGECNGVLLSFEKLDYWNPLLQAGAPDIDLIYEPYSDPTDPVVSIDSSSSSSSESTDSRANESEDSDSSSSSSLPLASGARAGGRDSKSKSKSNSASTLAVSSLMALVVVALL